MGVSSPFEFIEAEDSPGEYIRPKGKSRFGMFPDWVENWMGKLFPWVREEEDWPYAAQRFGFVCGVLVGCKIMGATREQLMEKSRGFVMPAIGHARYTAEG